MDDDDRESFDRSKKLPARILQFFLHESSGQRHLLCSAYNDSASVLTAPEFILYVISSPLSHTQPARWTILAAVETS